MCAGLETYSTKTEKRTKMILTQFEGEIQEKSFDTVVQFVPGSDYVKDILGFFPHTL